MRLGTGTAHPRAERAPYTVLGGPQQLGWSKWLGKSALEALITGMRFEPELYIAGRSRMSNKNKLQGTAQAPSKTAPATHDWLAPLSADAPCGIDLAYDPEFVVLRSQVAAREETQYGDFVSVSEPVNWSDVD